MGRLQRVLRIFFACLLLALGLAGLVLPILPGWLFISLAAVILGSDIRLFRKIQGRIAARFPTIRRLVQKILRAIPIRHD
jgi:uncharacterized membrane protein YbaN (DUF454 family)